MGEQRDQGIPLTKKGILELKEAAFQKYPNKNITLRFGTKKRY
jgi:hypothetical protein